MTTVGDWAFPQEETKKRAQALNAAVNRVLKWVLYTFVAFAAYAEYVHGGAYALIIGAKRPPECVLAGRVPINSSDCAWRVS